MTTTSPPDATGPPLDRAHAPVSTNPARDAGIVEGAERDHLAQGFGRTLRGYRKMRGLTQGTVARRAGVSMHTVSQYETGKRRPGASTVAALAAVLNYSDPESLTNDLRAKAGKSWRPGRAWKHAAPRRRLTLAKAQRALREAQSEAANAGKIAKFSPGAFTTKLVDEARAKVRFAREDLDWIIASPNNL